MIPLYQHKVKSFLREISFFSVSISTPSINADIAATNIPQKQLTPNVDNFLLANPDGIC
jgi:hypothetical protein